MRASPASAMSSSYCPVAASSASGEAAARKRRRGLGSLVDPPSTRLVPIREDPSADAEGPESEAKRQRHLAITTCRQAACGKRDEISASRKPSPRTRIAARMARTARRRPVPGVPGAVFLNSMISTYEFSEHISKCMSQLAVWQIPTIISNMRMQRYCFG